MIKIILKIHEVNKLSSFVLLSSRVVNLHVCSLHCILWDPQCIFTQLHLASHTPLPGGRGHRRGATSVSSLYETFPRNFTN